MKLFTVKTTPAIIDELTKSDDYYTRHLRFDREFLLIYTKKMEHYDRPMHKMMYSVKESHKPQGTMLSESQFLALFLIPEEARMPFLTACQTVWRNNKVKML